MSNQPTEESIVKAASAGFAQSLINKGVDEATAAKLTLAYAHPTEGMLAKRASNIHTLQAGVANIVQALRAKRG